MVIDMSLMIKGISKNILCELEVAENYMDYVFEWKDVDKKLADVYYEIANDELDHIDDLHEQVVKIIGESKKDSDIEKDTLDIMTHIWDFQHGIIMERITKLKIKMKLYEEMK